MNSDPNPEPLRDREANLAFSTSHELERAVWDDINAITADSLLTHRDAADELTRAIEQADAAPLALAEIRDTLDRLAEQTSSPLSELESLLAAPATESLALERGLLAELLRDGAVGQQVIKRGLLFCKHRRYADAIEWWTLNRRGLGHSGNRHLLRDHGVPDFALGLRTSPRPDRAGSGKSTSSFQRCKRAARKPRWMTNICLRNWRVEKAIESMRLRDDLGGESSRLSSVNWTTSPSLGSFPILGKREAFSWCTATAGVGGRPQIPPAANPPARMPRLTRRNLTTIIGRRSAGIV